MNAALFYLGMSTASVLSAIEGNRLAMFIAALWAFEVLLAEGLGRVRRGRRA
ncbi:hypothetical protein DEU35_1459 [Microbacterium sp. AG157]|uniref:hypothetical protein n=1 Tax=Microbacterium sp. AG157 TaxID=2183993 RepID=UPI000E384A97|nr:hypothetical protein [Microbacterium sp. AG157]REC98359.1 hypothetical protein DEU35_1459 [Microbacterium sp. AG157]